MSTTAVTTDTATLATRPAPGCTTCELGLAHCHAPVVEHHDGTFECLDGCPGPRAVHDVVVACVEVGLGCCHDEPVSSSPPVDVPWAA
jgi:hypothetical protein